MNDEPVCGYLIVQRTADRSVMTVPCGRTPGHGGNHRTLAQIEAERERAQARWDEMTPEERAEHNRKKRARSERRQKKPQ
jgi:hypothetical protein